MHVNQRILISSRLATPLRAGVRCIECVFTYNRVFVSTCVLASEVAMSLANNPERVQQLKTTLREKCLAGVSKLVADTLCSEVEHEYRTMWNTCLDSR